MSPSINHLNIYGRFWSDFWTALCTNIIRTPTKEISFGRMLFIPLVQIQRLVESMPRSAKIVLVAHGTLAPY